MQVSINGFNQPTPVTIQKTTDVICTVTSIGLPFLAEVMKLPFLSSYPLAVGIISILGVVLKVASNACVDKPSTFSR